MIALHYGNYWETVWSAFAIVFWSKQRWRESSHSRTLVQANKTEIKLSHEAVLIKYKSIFCYCIDGYSTWMSSETHVSAWYSCNLRVWVFHLLPTWHWTKNWANLQAWRSYTPLVSLIRLLQGLTRFPLRGILVSTCWLSPFKLKREWRVTRLKCICKLGYTCQSVL